jgi:hypothetical protein
VSLKTLILFFQAVVLVSQWLRDRQLAGVAREQALKEIKDVFDKRVDRAAAVRRMPDDPGTDSVHDDPTIYRD